MTRSKRAQKSQPKNWDITVFSPWIERKILHQKVRFCAIIYFPFCPTTAQNRWVVWYKTPLNWYKSVGEKTSQIPTDFDILGWNFKRFVYNKYTENVGSPDLAFTHRFVIEVHCCLGASGGWLVHHKCPPVFTMSDSQIPTGFFRKTLNIHGFISVSRCYLILP